VYDVVKQLGCLLRYSLDKGFVFDPLREFVDVDINPAEFSWRRLERYDHIQPPACKGPRYRNRL
jgi:hypothetical protein